MGLISQPAVGTTALRHRTTPAHFNTYEYEPVYQTSLVQRELIHYVSLKGVIYLFLYWNLWLSTGYYRKNIDWNWDFKTNIPFKGYIINGISLVTIWAVNKVN